MPAREIVLHVDAASAARRPDGSAARPYCDLEAARDALRRRRRGTARALPARVLVAPGVYRLERPLVLGPEDGGTARAPVTWRGHGGRPVVSGGRVVSGWSAGEINGRPCWRAVLPEVAAGRWWFTQLFVNGRRRLRARAPKQGFFRFAGVPEEEAAADPGGFFHGAMSARFEPGALSAFRNLADAEVVVPDHWYENHLRVAAVDEAAGVVRFETRGHSRFSRDETGRHARFRVDHAPELCTEPGEWVLERAGGVLSYIPLPGEDMGEALVEAPVLDHLLSLRGDPLDPGKRVRHLRLEFLDFRHAEWELPRVNAGAIQAAINVPAAVRLVGAERCALHGCAVSGVAGWGVEVLRGCHGNRIVACALHDLGGGGVKIGHEGGPPAAWTDGAHGAFRGQDPEALGWGPPRAAEGGPMPGRSGAEPSATTVSDCVIRDGGLIFHSAIGVWIGDASRNRVVHNRVENFTYTGISCGWNWGYMPADACDNRIEGNHILRIGHGMLSDMGAVYTLGRQAGGSVSRNLVQDVRSNGYGGWGLYTDEGTSWLTVEENVVLGTKCGGFHQHYGRDNRVRRNVFAASAECQLAITRREMVRPLVFERNLAQGAADGRVWSGLWSGGWEGVPCERNVYAADPGRAARFGGLDWAAWQAAGRDRRGLLLDALPLDAEGGFPAVADRAALRPTGLSPADIARVVAGAGPRFRGALPASIDAVPPEPERRRPVVESCFWPWPAEWPGEHPWNQLPRAVSVVAGTPQPVSLTLENRGDARASGRYRLRVVPAGAARLAGPKDLEVALPPGGRAALEAAVVPTGAAAAFRVEALAEGEGLFDSALVFEVAPAAREVLAAVGAPGAWGGDLPHWAEAMRDLPGTAPYFLDEGEIPLHRGAAGLPPERTAPLLALAATVRNDPALLRFAWYLHWRAFVAPQHGCPWGAPLLTRRLGPDAGLFYELLCLGYRRKLEERHRRLGYPEPVTIDTMQQIAIYDRNHLRARGVPGVFEGQFAWLAMYLVMPYVRLGRLEYALGEHQGPGAWRRACDGRVLVLAPDGTRVGDDGLVLHADAPAGQGWTASLREDGRGVRGFPVDPAGRILRREVALGREEWTPVLRAGDPVLDLHIPSGGGLDPAAVRESVARALDFFPRHHPDRPVRALTCCTWFLDPRLGGLLEPGANLLRLQRSVYLVPATTRDGGLWHVFLRDPLATPPAALPRETGLQRALAGFLAGGGRWNGGSMLVLADDLPRLREGLYTEGFAAFARDLGP